MKTSDIDMRDAFFDEVYNIAKKDRNVIFLTADMGAFSLGRFKKDLPGQYINAGVAEQNMISIAAGLTLGGKRVFAYGIAPFVTMRCYEQIKVDLCCMNLPVTIVSVGSGFTYGSDGPTHHATHDIAVMRTLPEITILNPSDPIMASACARISYGNSGPKYVRVERGKLPLLYSGQNEEFANGLSVLKEGSDMIIIATGIMVHKALEAADKLSKNSIYAGVVDLYRIKPVNAEMLLEVISRYKKIVTLEENSLLGGIGSIVSELLSDYSVNIPLKRIAAKDFHCYDYGDRDWINSRLGLDTDGIVGSILNWNSSLHCKEY